jgi:hypothetical protein
MDRIALAKRLESLSSVFASHTPYNRDLRAMSYVLNKMADDKFTGILSGDFSSDELDACMCGGGGAPEIIPMGGSGKPGMPGMMPVGPMDEEKKVIVIKDDGGMPMSAEATEKTAGMFWCKEASKAIVDNLLRDVVGMNKSVCCDTGRKLEKDQIPDGGHDGEKAKTLTPEQTPDDAASIKTDMVAKSHGAVKKEASLEDIKKAKAKKEDEKVKADVEDLKKAKAKKEKAASEEEGEKAEEEAEKKEEKAKELLEEADKDEKKAEEAEGEKDATVEPIAAVKPIAALEPSSSTFEGIELMTSMDEVELDAGEAAELSKLFE